jgi:hypothetical protein
MQKIPNIDDIRKAIVISDAEGKPVSGAPGEGKFTFCRAPGPAAIPVQFIVRELQLAYPKANFTFVTSAAQAKVSRSDQP